MKLRNLTTATALTLLLALSAAASAQTPDQQPGPSAPASPYKVMIFEIKHRDPDTLAKALDGLRSSGPNTAMVPNRSLRTITVRDYPENISAIADAIKRLDVPEVAKIAELPVDIEINLHLIAASQTAGEKTPFPQALEPVIAQMRATLKFTNYRYMTALTNRINDQGTIHASGVISAPFPTHGKTIKTNYTYSIRTVRTIMDATGKHAFGLSGFRFNLAVPVELDNGGHKMQDAGIITELNLRDGETAVVGTANVGSSDEAIILIVTAKKVR
ncbi:MAG: hypothetical protein KF868_00245 [Acidobacteria bacterium]|nr:hypothetical protein [Acidobacteriota bacterium]MCW5969455.1 hypothetical protein [Blastocatellales bacterium]